MGERRRSYVQLFYHFIWSTKNREPVINEEIKALLRESFGLKAEELKLRILECDGIEDHMHILLSSPATLAPSDIAKHLKGASSHHVNENISQMNFHWQDGYGVVSVSPKDILAVRGYIRNQKEHHGKGTLNERLERDSAN
ncbi:MAG TPA: IS200/IS605 family transposase [Bacteroidota bacterium]|nr:IS200/IS605 family transposase [Bacteroidota bacterium]